MTRRDGSGTGEGPTEDEVEHDFTVPGDADLRPAEDVGGEDLDEDRP